MARGNSGRIVVGIDPRLKRRLYAALTVDSLTLKDWFTRRAEEQVAEREQPPLFPAASGGRTREPLS